MKKIIKQISSVDASIFVKANDSCIYYGAYIDEQQLVGVIGRRFRAWFLTELCHLFVMPEYRRKGIGTSLIAHAIEKVQTPLACATVLANNRDSEKVFLKLGFKEVSTFENPNTENTVKVLIKKV